MTRGTATPTRHMSNALLDAPPPDEAGEQHTYMQTASLLSKQLASGKEAERVKALLASDSSRRLYHKGLLSKLNDEQKRVNMAQGIGRSYFFLFSNMLLFTKREGTVEREQTFHIQEHHVFRELHLVVGS